jgi:hypothetical protein
MKILKKYQFKKNKKNLIFFKNIFETQKQTNSNIMKKWVWTRVSVRVFLKKIFVLIFLDRVDTMMLRIDI